MFGKLKIDGEGSIECKKIAKAIYKELWQKDKLFAEVIITDEAEIQQLNKELRGIDKVTDVLSFPTLDGIRGKVLKASDYPLSVDGKYLSLGSVAICAEQAARQAVEYGHSDKREYTYLTVHGLLHLFGYDHMNDEDKKEMRAIEKKVLKRLKLGDEEC